jgi:nucleoside-diphosphate-sugar epimerase
MKVFVAGATGVLGRRAVARMVAAGHEVTGVARTPEKAASLRAIGVTPVTVDVFDAGAVKDAVAGHDAVCNLATHIPPTLMAAMPGSWAQNDRIRTEVSRNLVDAALVTGATRYVQESIAFLYADEGDGWLDEDSPIVPVGYVESTLVAEAEAARFTATSAGGAGVVLRFGLFHGPDSNSTIETVALARRGIAAAVGEPDAYQAFVTTDDAAAAVLAALDEGVGAGVYNVVDDEPLTRTDYAAALAGAVGRSSLRLPPKVATKLGGSKTGLLGRSQRVSNRRFVAASGWRPSSPSAREAWPKIVAEMGEPPAQPRLSGFVRAALASVGAGYALLGAWALVAPQGFFDTFPGGGHHWVDVDGPFNEHLVRDFGALNLAVAFVLLVAAVKGGRTLVRTAAVASLLWSAPHLAYHLAHTDVLPGLADRVSNLSSLALTVVLPVAALVISQRWPASPKSPAVAGAMVR